MKLLNFPLFSPRCDALICFRFILDRGVWINEDVSLRSHEVRLHFSSLVPPSSVDVRSFCSDIDLVVLGVTKFNGDAEPMFALADQLRKRNFTADEPKVLTGAKVNLT